MLHLSSYNRIGKSPAKSGTSLEVPPGFEPGNNGFADRCLTTWLWYHTDLNKGSSFFKALSLRKELLAPDPKISWQFCENLIFSEADDELLSFILYQKINLNSPERMTNISHLLFIKKNKNILFGADDGARRRSVLRSIPASQAQRSFAALLLLSPKSFASQNFPGAPRVRARKRSVSLKAVFCSKLV